VVEEAFAFINPFQSSMHQQPGVSITFFTFGRLAGNETGNLMKESLRIHKICLRKDLHARFCIFSRNLAPDFPHYISGKEFGKNENLYCL